MKTTKIKYRCKDCGNETATKEVDIGTKEVNYYCIGGCGDYYGSSCQKVNGECILCNKECGIYKKLMKKRFENEIKIEWVLYFLTK